MHWLRGSQDGPAPRDAGFWGEIGYRVERDPRCASSDAVEREAAPVAVPVGDGGVAERRAAARRGRPDRVVQLARGRSLRARPAARPAPARHQPGPLAGVRRLPAGAATSTSRSRCRTRAGTGTLPVLVRRYGDGLKLVLSQDMTERERSEAMRRDFVANVSHEIRTPLTVLSGFLETLRNLPLTEVERKRVLVADDAADRAHGQPGQRPADAGAARRQPAAGRRPLGRAGAAAGAGRGRGASAVGRPAHAGRFRRRRTREIAGARERAAQRDRQPRQQRGALHARGRPHRGRAGSCSATAAARSPSATPAPASPANTCRA